ncbi:hypothetical protein [Pectinatus frisingensis]|uniref:hypothetical protein n=1 Tax=Pectinatus frisingensis TaxID=865 RepID=UPI0018C56890|nr:hypothetical protein [Pectinatus frisingensis]
MDKFKSFFDDFTFHARVMPVIVVLAPIIMIGLIKGIIQYNWGENSALIFLSLVFLTIFSKIARNIGKGYEKKMYAKLGGMPTTIVLRFSDNTFDDITKQRYHKKLNQFRGLNLPLDKSNENADDDQQYISATNILRNYANSNHDKEPRVYQELKEYNFWRNLYGTKGIALFLYLVIAIREIILKGIISLNQAFLHPYPDYIALIIMVLCIVSIVLFVNKKTVTQKGFDYAKTLIEVCERIPTDICEKSKV